jgi:hypothetical protein
MARVESFKAADHKVIRTIYIDTEYQVIPEDFTTRILYLSLQQVTELKFRPSEKILGNTYFPILSAFLLKLPAITTLWMDLPFKPYDKDKSEPETQFYEVQDLKIVAHKQLASTVPSFVRRFPNLSSFSLYGEWSKETETRFDLHFNEHALEFLELDIQFTKNNVAQDHSNRHFLLKIVNLSSKRKYVYRVTFSSLNMEEVDATETKDPSNKLDYLKIQITALELKRMYLSLYRNVVFALDNFDVLKSRVSLI